MVTSAACCWWNDAHCSCCGCIGVARPDGGIEPPVTDAATDSGSGAAAADTSISGCCWYCALCW